MTSKKLISNHSSDESENDFEPSDADTRICPEDDIMESRRGTKFRCKIPGVKNGNPLLDIVVVADKRAHDELYCVHKSWIDLQDGLIYTPTSAGKKVNDEELVKHLLLSASPTTVQEIPWTTTRAGTSKTLTIRLKWTAFMIKGLYKDFALDEYDTANEWITLNHTTAKDDETVISSITKHGPRIRRPINKPAQQLKFVTKNPQTSTQSIDKYLTPKNTNMSESQNDNIICSPSIDSFFSTSLVSPIHSPIGPSNNTINESVENKSLPASDSVLFSDKNRRATHAEYDFRNQTVLINNKLETMQEMISKLIENNNVLYQHVIEMKQVLQAVVNFPSHPFVPLSSIGADNSQSFGPTCSPEPSLQTDQSRLYQSPVVDNMKSKLNLPINGKEDFLAFDVKLSIHHPNFDEEIYKAFKTFLYSYDPRINGQKSAVSSLLSMIIRMPTAETTSPVSDNDYYITWLEKTTIYSMLESVFKTWDQSLIPICEAEEKWNKRSFSSRIHYIIQKWLKTTRQTAKRRLDFGSKKSSKTSSMTSSMTSSKTSSKKTIKKKWTNELMTAQCFLFFAAGSDTSSTILSMTFLELAMNEDIQNKLHEEIDIFSDANDGNITYELIKSMPYLHKVVQETLRKYPVLPFLSRVCTKTYNVPDTDIIIEKGTDVVIPIAGIHRDAEIYPNPEVYDPERFNPEEIQSRHKFQYLPFGEGPRNCIGARFGLIAVKLGIIYILKKFHLKRTPNTVYPMRFTPNRLGTVCDCPVVFQCLPRLESCKI